MAGVSEHRPLQVFVLHSRKDASFREELEARLAQLVREGLIEYWHEQMIEAGQEWKGTIDHKLTGSEIVLLLVSGDFLASEYSHDVEMIRALAKHEAGQARVIPVILRPVDWNGAPFGKLPSLPRDGRPATTRRHRDEVWREVAEEIRRAVEELRAAPALAGSPVETVAAGSESVDEPSVLEPEASRRLAELFERQARDGLSSDERRELAALMDDYGSRLHERRVQEYAAQRGLTVEQARHEMETEFDHARAWWLAFQADPSQRRTVVTRARRRGARAVE